MRHHDEDDRGAVEVVDDDYRVFRMPSPRGTARPPFLLLHGVGLSHRSFTRAARLLARSAEVIAIDLPGFGGTRRPSHPRSVEQYAHGVAAVLDRAATGSLLVVGHSMGCQIGLELALIRPDLVSAVVMIGPVVDPRSRTLVQQGTRLLRDALLEPWRTNLMVSFDYARCGVAWYLAETRAMLAYPTHERITALRRPLLVLRGANDVIARPDWVSWLAAQPAHGRAQSTAGHRHNVVHSLPANVAASIIRFTETLGEAR